MTGRVNKPAPNDAPSPQLLQEHLHGLLKASWRDFRKGFKRCQSELSEKPVHQLRVAARRLQALLGLLEELVGAGKVAPPDRALKKVLRRFAQLRDTQVLLLQLERNLRSFPEARSFHKALQGRERRLIRKMGRCQSAAPLAKIKRGLSALDKEARKALAGDGPRGHAWGRLLGTVGVVTTQLVALRTLCRENDLASIHRFRIAFKRFRYTVELLQPVWPGVTRRHLTKLRAGQNRLGAIQDAEVLLAALEKFSRNKPVQDLLLRRFRGRVERQRNARIHAFLRGPNRIRDLFRWMPAGGQPSHGR